MAKNKESDHNSESDKKRGGFLKRLLGLGIIVGAGVAIKKALNKDKGGSYEPE